jgi:hypothetical protein
LEGAQTRRDILGSSDGDVQVDFTKGMVESTIQVVDRIYNKAWYIGSVKKLVGGSGNLKSW